MRFPGFIGPSYQLQSVNADCQRAVNLYLEVNALGTGKEHEPACLVGTPGLRLLATLPNSPVRGLWRASNNQLFAVGGNKLYEVYAGWVAVERGTLSTGTGPVSLADNGTSLVMVDGIYGYALNLTTNVFAQITDPDFQAADLVTFQDGYFIFNASGTGQFFISDLNAVTFDALDIATAEALPDELIGIASDHQHLYLFGSQSIEGYYDSGDVFPFSRIQGAVVGVGCSAAFSIQLIDGIPFWIGGSELGQGTVYKLQGYQPVRISTFAIESVIRDLDQTDIADARAWSYEQGGHKFYCFTIPGMDSTWCYDVSTGFWHERQYRNGALDERHRADCHAAAYGTNVVGDYDNGNLYALDPEVYSDEVTDGSPTVLVSKRTAPHASSGLKNIFHKSFHLDMETGVGLDGDVQGSDPQVMLRYSDDGGHTWSTERTKSAGAIGETKTRVKFNRLGRARDRVYEVSFSDPCKRIFLGAEIDVEEGVA